MIKSKYQDVLTLGEELNIQNGDVQEENGLLKIKGLAQTQYEKNLIWDKIKEIGGESPADIQVDIQVAETAFFHKHIVKKGESLSKIAKQYYGDPMQYKSIYEANKSILKNPDTIHPDQELVIPNL